MTNRLIQITLSLSLMLLSSVSIAAKRLKVELLIFEHSSSPEFETNMANTHPGLPDFAKAIYLQTSPAARYRQLTYKYYTLGGAKARLTEQKGYRTLEHIAWIQPASPSKNSKYIHILGGDTLNSAVQGEKLRELQGIVKVSQSKYPHISLDLILREPSHYYSRFNLGLTQTKHMDSPYQTYRLSEKQRLKFDKIFYIDHPKLGVIVKVSKYPS